MTFRIFEIPTTPNGLNPISDIWISPIQLNGNNILTPNVFIPVQYSFTGKKWFSKIEVALDVPTVGLSRYEIRFFISPGFGEDVIIKDIAYESMKRGSVSELWELNTTAGIRLGTPFIPSGISMTIQRHLLDGTLVDAKPDFITHVRVFERNVSIGVAMPDTSTDTTTDTSTDTLTNDP